MTPQLLTAGPVTRRIVSLPSLIQGAGSYTGPKITGSEYGSPMWALTLSFLVGVGRKYGPLLVYHEYIRLPD